MSVGQRLVLLVAMPAIGAGVIWWSMNRTLNEVRVGGEMYQRVALQSELLADILPPPLFLVELYATAQSLTTEAHEDKRAALLETVERLSADYAKRTAYWKDKTIDGDVRRAVFETAGEPATELLNLVKNELVPATKSGDLNSASGILRDKVTPAFQRHATAIVEASATTIKQAEIETQKTMDEVTAARTGSYAFALGTLALVLPLSYLMVRSIRKPIRQLSGAMHDVASGTGNLTVRIDLGGDRSELGQLAENFNGFVRCINGVVVEIDKAAKGLRGSADQISASAEESQRATQHQTESLRTMSQSIDQLSGSAMNIAQSSNKANDSAEMTGRVAAEGDLAVQQTIAGMGRIDSTVAQGAQSVSELGQRSKQIGQIISVINDIADQTNLLALNAAIEAARAGEHGRGFAVVADEVRKLAERTTSATTQVSESIGEIQSMTSNSVQCINAGSEEVKRGIVVVQGTTQGLKRIVEQAGETRRLIGTIAQSAQEQARLGEGIRDGVRQVGSAAEELERTSAATAQNTSDLVDRSRQLMDLVARFQIDRGA
jgi:methyl-accepting chemotaxis protein